MRVRLFVIVWLSLTCWGLATLELAGSTLNFPRVTFSPTAFTGVVVVNPAAETAQMTFRLINEDGTMVQRPGLTNPRLVSLPSGQQFGDISTHLFGLLEEPDLRAWIQVTSPTPGLTGFFLDLNQAQTFVDGAEPPPLAEHLLLTNIPNDPNQEIEITILNPNEEAASISVTVLGGAEPVEVDLGTLPPLGTRRLDPRELIADDAEDDLFLLIDSNQPIGAFEFVRTDSDILGLNAVPVSELLNRIYIPQLVVLGGYQSELIVVNPSPGDSVAQVYAYQADGELFGEDHILQNPVPLVLRGASAIRVNLEELFGFHSQDTGFIEGWVSVETPQVAIQGAVTYSFGGQFSAAAPSAGGATEAVFGHIATTAGFFTGLAILNPSTLGNDVQIIATKANGDELGRITLRLRPGRRVTALLSDLIPEAAEQSGGIIWIASENSVFMTALFGSLRTGALANIPPQSVLGSNNLNTEFGLRLEPRYLPLPTRGTEGFEVIGGSGSAEWSVNGVPGGDATSGTVVPTMGASSGAEFSAPVLLPGQPSGLSAALGRDTIGATIDILGIGELLGGRPVIASVAFLSGLQRLFTAELAASGASSLGVVSTTIVDVTGDPAPVTTIDDSQVSNMVPFEGSNGREFLLLAGAETGNLFRIDPLVQELQVVRNGLNNPTAIAVDSVTNNVFVAVADGIETIPADAIEGTTAGVSMATRRAQPRQGTALEAVSGLAVDSCTGDVYASLGSAGAVVVIDRETGTVTTVADGLADTAGLLSLQRLGLPCPLSFRLLIADRDRILQFGAVDGELSPWAEIAGAAALSFVQTGRPPLAQNQGVFVGQTADAEGRVLAVDFPPVFGTEPINPPFISRCLGPVEFDDANLSAAVRDTLDLEADTPVSCEAAETVTSLDASARGILELGGIENLVNLGRLTIAENSITNLSPLASLMRLTDLDLGTNSVADVSVLASLPNLEFVNLHENQVGDVTSLVANMGLGQGDRLVLTRNPLQAQNCGAIQQLELRGLTVERDPIELIFRDSDLEQAVRAEFLRQGIPLPDGRLTCQNSLLVDTLLLSSEANIDSVDGLEGFANLQELDVAAPGSIADLMPLSFLPRLEGLAIDGHEVADLAPIQRAVSMIRLSLGRNQIIDLEPLTNLTALHHLDLSDNLISDISPLVDNDGLGPVDRVGNTTTPASGEDVINLLGNPLGLDACGDIAQIESRGAIVQHSLPCSGPSDFCANAPIVPGPSYSSEFSTVLFTIEDTEPQPSCPADFGGTIGATGWLRFNTDSGGFLHFSTSGSDFDTVVALYTGSCGNLEEVACNDDSRSSLLAMLDRVPVSKGVDYYLQIGGFALGDNAGASGNAEIEFRLLPNESCTEAAIIASDLDLFSSTIDTTHFEDEPGEPLPSCATNSGKTAWYSFQPRVAGTVTVDTAGSSFDTVLQVYSGSCSNLTPIDCNGDVGDGDLTSQLSFRVSPNSVYFIQAAGLAAEAGMLQLSYTFEPAMGQ